MKTKKDDFGPCENQRIVEPTTQHKQNCTPYNDTDCPKCNPTSYLGAIGIKPQSVAQHTPIPWHIEKDPSGNWWFENVDGGFTGKVDEQISEADAAFIVRAVNVHEELLQTLEAIANDLIVNENFDGDHPTILAIQKAIAKAEGK